MIKPQPRSPTAAAGAVLHPQEMEVPQKRHQLSEERPVKFEETRLGKI